MFLFQNLWLSEPTNNSSLKRFAIAGLSAVIVLLVACSAEPTDPLIEATRQLALLQGILIEDAGCLRVAPPDRPDGPGWAVVWQKDIFEVTRSGDEITIVDLFGRNGQPNEPVIWRLGEVIRGGGGEARLPGAIEHAGAEFPEKCAGPYWLVSMVR